MKKKLLLSGVLFAPLAVFSQQLTEGYIDYTGGQEFYDVIKAYEKGTPLYDTEDENFFISRVKPKARFTNPATQVFTSITAENDKKLLFWVPIGNEPWNALPNGKFDSEVFPMWNYITHYGNWTARFVRMPGAFSDVAHKNGVGVSVTAGIPWAVSVPASNSDDYWTKMINSMIEVGPEKMSEILKYYGIDGLGYNSEFYSNQAYMTQLINYLKEIHKLGSEDNPVFDNIWYDGTNDNGGLTFDRGLRDHNDLLFGHEGEETTEFFFNYNWGSAANLQGSVDKANEIGRSPLDLHAGINMQGGNPRNWTLLKDYPISVGLWGAHSQNMFFESRGEKGALPTIQQRTYLHRVERYFTGGTRNPLNSPAISNYNSYSADNFNWFGMSKMMSAKSSLSWDLATEPFVTNFNLGNGTFFNWMGERQVTREWYNIGVQDHLPTWRFWFADKFLGKEATDVPADGLDAEFTWNDAWMGGSSLRIWGTTANEYLHLFKTQFAIASGDEITVRYKINSGNTDLNLALSVVGAESTPIAEERLELIATETAQYGEWIEKTFMIRGGLAAIADQDLAMVALHFENAKDIDLYLGEFSIKRGEYTTPQAPEVTLTKALNSTHKGVDGKIIFNMPNDQEPGDPVYNIDVDASMFKLYAQQEGEEPILTGVTTSWAGMYFSVPFNFEGASNIRFGVSAVSLDLETESEIVWGEYTEQQNYIYNDNITITKPIIKPNEDFAVCYEDDLHEDGNWEITNANGDIVASSMGTKLINVNQGLPEVGNYDLKLTGKLSRNDSTRVDSTLIFKSFIQITSLVSGALPKIEDVLINNAHTDVESQANEPLSLSYVGRPADGIGSRGVDLKEKGLGFRASDLDMQPGKSFSVAFWLKINQINGYTQMLNVRDKLEGWPKTDWGWLWNSFSATDAFSVVLRGSSSSNNNEVRYWYENFKIAVGAWTHYAYVFEYNDAGQIRVKFFVNGQEELPSKWTRTSNPTGSTDASVFHSDVYGMRGANVIAVGGTAAGRAGIDGVMDNFQYWNKAMTLEDVKLSMDKVTEMPTELEGYWDFETDPAEDGGFVSTGTKTAKAGAHTYATADGEGMGVLTWIPVAGFVPGSPFLEGTAFKVTTVPQWITSGTVSEATGDDESGLATVSFAQSGVHTITLKLSNSWGSDTKTYPLVEVGTVTSLDEVKMTEILNAYPNPFQEEVALKFNAEGKYTVKIVDLFGRVISERVNEVATGDVVLIGVNAAAGIYNALVYNEAGDLVQAIKLMKK